MRVRHFVVYSCFIALLGCGGGSGGGGGGSRPSVTSPATLPDATAGEPYTFTFTASGGKAPLTWDVPAGSTLPAGLTLNSSSGELSGTPTAAGQFVFNVRVTGSNGKSQTEPVSLEVVSLPAGILYVKTNGGPNLGDTNLTTWRFNDASTIDGDVEPDATLEGSSTKQRYNNGLQIFLEEGNDRLWFTSGRTPGGTPAEVFLWTAASTRDGDAIANGILGGTDTKITGPNGIAVDTGRDSIYVAEDDRELLVFRNISIENGNRAPDAIVSGDTNADFTDIQQLFLDVTNDVLYIADMGAGAIKVYNNASTLTTGDVAPSRVITNTALVGPRSVFLDTTRDLLYIGDPDAAAIHVYENGSTVNGDVAPDRTIAGANTTLGGFFDMTVHPARDEIYVANENPPSILVFDDASTLDGNVTPDRVVTNAALEETDREPNAIAIDRTR